ncbi:unnamed protein product [Tenebrio molitor]|jgi:hypothetical protein|nr:unnamed protein product [Tenebrio molitor]
MAKDKIKGFIKKIRLWSTSLQRMMYESFLTFRRLSNAHISCMMLSLHNLEEKLLSYFPEQVSETGGGQRWILNPFLDMSVQLAVLIAKTKEDLLDIAADGMLKMEFNSQKINVFWMKRKEEYPKLESRISRAGKGSFEIERHSPHPTYVYYRSLQ